MNSAAGTTVMNALRQAGKVHDAIGELSLVVRLAERLDGAEGIEAAAHRALVELRGLMIELGRRP